MRARNVIRILATAGIALLVAGCTVTYRVGGVFEDSNEPFSGTVTVITGGGGTINVNYRNGKVVCTGTSQVMKQPSGYSRIGVKGRAEAKCTDGRSFKVDFLQTRETGGNGRGLDDQGNVVRIFFDESEDLINAKVREAVLRSLIP